MILLDVDFLLNSNASIIVLNCGRDDIAAIKCHMACAEKQQKYLMRQSSC